MEYVTIKVYASTRKDLRLIAAETGEQMAQVMDRLCREELAKVRQKPQDTAQGEMRKTKGSAV